jgi:hypothetical protein
LAQKYSDIVAGFWLDGGNVDMVRARLIRRNTVSAIPTRPLADTYGATTQAWRRL